MVHAEARNRGNELNPPRALRLRVQFRLLEIERPQGRREACGQAKAGEAEAAEGWNLRRLTLALRGLAASLPQCRRGSRGHL